MKNSPSDRIARFMAPGAAIAAIAAMAVLPPPLQAQTLYTWDGGASTTAWEDANNWNPDGVPTPGTDLHNVQISTAVTVVRTDALGFNFNPASTVADQTVLVLSNSGNLSVADNLQVQSSSRVRRDVLIASGSELSVAGRLQAGSGNTSKISVWTINGTVTANTFQGLVPSTLTGGYSVLLDGGEFNITTTFNWKNQTFSGTPTGNFTLSNNGTMTIGEMSSDWTDYSGFYVNFADATGSLSFGKTFWSTLESVQSLISNNHIRTDVAQAFQITDNDTSWTVTVIPEPSTGALLAGSFMAALALFRRRR
jgi:hypothetical protein